MARFNLDDYIDVAERIDVFYEKYPEGRILTELLNVDGWNGKQTQFIVKSYLYDGEVLLSTGLAEESFGGSGPNATSALENAETSSIGRACANLNFATTRNGSRQRPSRQEMAKVQRGVEPSPVDNLKEMLAGRFSELGERKAYVEGIVGRSLGALTELSDREIAEVMLELATL
jgi:hypothetical protein